MARLEQLKADIDNQGTAGLYPGEKMTRYHVHLSEDPKQPGYKLVILGSAGGNSKDVEPYTRWEELLSRVARLPGLPDTWEML